MYGGILISYNLMKNQKNYTFSKSGNYITYLFNNNTNLINFKSYYENWLIEKGYNLNKVKKITALIYLNMAPLHYNKFDDLLYFYSIKMLNDINDK